MLFLALVLGVSAVSHFTYAAYNLTDYVKPGSETHESRESADLDSYEAAHYTDAMQFDAMAVLVAVGLLIGSIAISRKLKRHRRR